ncbi:Uncharacterised protein [uncultured archaeon]|nr:Uncharacterised protein [uncultured archaeon]
MTDEIIDWEVTVSVEPALWEIEKTGLVTFAYKGKKIEFKENQNETWFSIKLKSTKENRGTEIDALMSYFLGRFELDGTRSYHYKIQNIKNLKTGKQSACTKIKSNKPVDTEYEKYIQKIDDTAASSNKDIIANSISAFHYADMAISPNHAYLSMTNAFTPLIQDIGKQERTVLSGLYASWILFKKEIIKDDLEKEHWDEELKWIHDTIDNIRYKNMQVNEKHVERIRKLYKEFLDMYVKYKQ